MPELIVYSSHLAEDYGHEEEVKQQCFRQMAVVQGEEEDGEEDGDILVGRTAVGGAKKLEACHCDHESSNPKGGGHFEQISVYECHVCNGKVYRLPWNVTKNNYPSTTLKYRFEVLVHCENVNFLLL